MGIFDGYLICSDIDGTLTVDRQTVEKNLPAIEYFISEGGSFTISTGRTAAYLRTMDFFYLINAPAIICNGSIIYDYKKEKVLRECKEDFSLNEFLKSVSIWAKSFEGLYVYFDAHTFIADNMAGKVFDSQSLGMTPVKIVCVMPDEKTADAFKAECSAMSLFKNSHISKSWNMSVEFNHINATKGSGVKFLKEHMMGIEKTIAIGDYDNDIEMLKEADLAVAVGDGAEHVLEISDMVVCRAADGALFDLISRLSRQKGGSLL